MCGCHRGWKCLTHWMRGKRPPLTAEVFAEWQAQQHTCDRSCVYADGAS